MNITITVTLKSGKVETVIAEDSENEVESEDCDSVIGYTQYDTEEEEIDGGEMDYNYEKDFNGDFEKLVYNLLSFIYMDISKIKTYHFSVND